ncbi:MAG: bifunctional phosphopantothenoylcysteine decarboxylase/phosphopantothenate--cysteine ligase CoaBC [Gammaproteobacteria bacterium]|nr:bifunctional phosphopantothenoylcysteine decarboxylase/phosphopantothenate--cysteine ligase CoaBC [Gammaproteobacteria bacterium]
MSLLEKKRVLLGVTGGIAAYKAAELVRLLTRAKAEVQVVMTPAASNFITPLTLQALSGRSVRQKMFDTEQEAVMGHIDLARWADLILVAPASADFISRLAVGMANDLLATLCLAATTPIALAPAMNREMWQNPATQANIQTLCHRGTKIWGPADGEQACGEIGPGRMLEPDELLEQIKHNLSPGVLHGVRVLLTAGPTREPIDPVRYVGNRSSGRMGYALASAFAAEGALVTMISGPVSLDTPEGVQRVDVETAVEMEHAVGSRVEQCDIFVACAAVADYRCDGVAKQKIKKLQERLELRLIRNPDILRQVAANEAAPFTVGFAAETERVAEQAEQKRRAKGVDMIAANLVAGERGGFESDENALTVLWEGGGSELPMMDKQRLAQSLVALIISKYHEKD